MTSKKTNINRKPVSSEEIASRRDFQSVLKGATAQPSQKPIYRSNWFIANMAIILIAAGTTMYLINNDASDDVPERVPYIQSPLPEVQVQMTNYMVSATSDQTVTHITGTEISIPAGAFADSLGNAVSGEVTIEYREFHDQVDIFLAGIPMEYDSAGTEYVLESAGMMEIRAFQNGKEVFLATGKTIGVNMKSRFPGTKYNVYELDTVQRNWVFRGKDSVTDLTTEKDQPADIAEPKAIVQTEKQLKTVRREIAQLTKQAPVSPGKLKEDRWNFNIKVDLSDFPELSAYKNAQWEVDESEKAFDPKYAQIMWEDVMVSKPAGENCYMVKFIRANQEVAFRANPVFDGKDFAGAQKVYDKKFADYSKKLQKRKDHEAKLVAELAEKRAEWLRQQAIAKAEAELRQQEWNLRNGQLAVEAAVNRAFSINNFGYWNCDHVPQFVRSIKQYMQFESNADTPLGIYKVSVVNPKRNAILTCNTRNYKKDNSIDVKYEESADNMIWTITENKQFAVVRFANFNDNIANASSASWVTMDIVEADIHSGDDLRRLLKSDFNLE